MYKKIMIMMRGSEGEMGSRKIQPQRREETQRKPPLGNFCNTMVEIARKLRGNFPGDLSREASWTAAVLLPLSNALPTPDGLSALDRRATFKSGRRTRRTAALQDAPRGSGPALLLCVS